MHGTIRETSIAAVRLALVRETRGRGFKRQVVDGAIECALRLIEDDLLPDELSETWNVPDSLLRDRALRHGLDIARYVEHIETGELGPGVIRMLAEHLKREMVDQLDRYLHQEYHRKAHVQQAVPA